MQLRNRRHQIIINRLRMGHIGLRAYLNRFSMSDEQYCENPVCYFQEFPETIEHFLLYCPLYTSIRNNLKKNLTEMKVTLFDVKTLLLGREEYSKMSRKIIVALLEYIYASGKTEGFF